MAFNIRGTEKTREFDIDELPVKQTKLEDVVITMLDGCKLYAHIWLPLEAERGEKKVGTLVEYIPYRKDDNTAMRDSIRHPFYAGNGFASIRIDMRGSGSSDGLLLDEYLKQEQDDCLECFDWIVSQKWSNGAIGMFGKSWGGFNSLQVAARQHPGLRTIITLMSTDDRYSDDVHYRGGCVLASDMLWWGSTMLAFNARPQDPKIVGPSWKQDWLERLKVPPFVTKWLSHQRRDSYWKHGSICEDYSKVTIPVLAVGGWRDGYTSAVFRMCENLPNKDSVGVVGPWVHEYPEVAEPSPKIGFQQLSVNWFRKYLEPDVHSDFKIPKMTVYVQEPCEINDSYLYRPGKWISLKNLQKKSISLKLNDDRKLISSDTLPKLNIDFTGSLDHGMFRGVFCPFGFKGDFPTDQRIEDAKCLTFDSDVLEDSLNLVGEPYLKLQISSDKPLANISVRLNDIYPSGESVLISWGMLNLSHRESHEFPKKLELFKIYDIAIKLDVLGVEIKKGHKIRVALSPTDWPLLWPTPETPTLTLFSGELELPVLNEESITDAPHFEGPSIVKSCEINMLKNFERRKQLNYDFFNDTWELTDTLDSGSINLPSVGNASGITFSSLNTNTWKIKPYDPLSAFTQSDYTLTYERGHDWNIKIVTRSSLSSDKNSFFLVNELEAYEFDKEIYRKVWKDTIPREFV
ncbi:uncharacterized protein PRCAT00006055001 [Priceomyces carsonii]|uniref:uncharacterized protein n=1 Tax=Priceomyces carsonii TaxID=28549 RepID=UPI002EDAA4DD|nr:unnamed protein product [Priceomyces carsonii]